MHSPMSLPSSPIPSASMWNTHYDVIIVGGGIVGCSLAHALSTIKRDKPLRIALLERSLEEPDRIVGELLQPGGIAALKNIGLEKTLDGIDAIPVYGYAVINKGKTVHIPYPAGHQGRSFHHGKFIMNLRDAARKARGVEVIEATVTSLIESNFSKRVTGVRATRKDSKTSGEEAEKESFFANLVIIADGCFSNFRTTVMGERFCKPVTKSHFVGLVLEDAELPIPKHGTVVLVENHGPVLLYQIGEHDTRLLIDIKQPLPADLKTHILTRVVPNIPPALQAPVVLALKTDRIRRMPNSFLPSVKQGTSSRLGKDGVFLIGDAWNMRHPLTGGGMTVGFNDVVLIRDLLAATPDWGQWPVIREALEKWHWQRKNIASTVNILSVALYDLFGADGEDLEVLRTGCFKYFERGGDCVAGPVGLLSVITPSPLILFNHFFSVAMYSIWCMFTHPRPVQSYRQDEKIRLVTPRIDEYPTLFLKALRVFWTACIVFGPLLWTEIRWWSPDDAHSRNKAFLYAVPYPLILGAAVAYAVRVF